MSAPLHPRGTLRARFEHLAAADVFRRLGVGARRCDLGDEGLYLAEELVAADVGWLGSSEHPEALAILVLALMIAQRQGSTRLPLAPGGPLRGLVTDIARVAGVELDVPRVLRTIANLTSAPRFNSVIGMRDARLPLVVDLGCAYTERSRWLEQRVATRIAERLAAPVVDVAYIVRDLAGPRPLSEEQARAVALALGSKLAVVTGGPGTGKTLVASAIVRGFARLGIEPVALAAQTGKAANRLTEVIAEQLAGAAARAGDRATPGAHDAAGPQPFDAQALGARDAAGPQPFDAQALGARDAAGPQRFDAQALGARDAAGEQGFDAQRSGARDAAGERSDAQLTGASASGERPSAPDAVVEPPIDPRDAGTRPSTDARAGDPEGGSEADSAWSNADRALAADPPTAQTLHRLLGYRGGRFAHHALSPLPVGAVIVDEASMLDLELVDALLDALPASAPLVLIGDAHQLPAIDAGQILADLTAPESPAASRVAVLATSYRQNTADPDGRAVYEAARAIHDGEVQRLFEHKKPLATQRTANRLIFRGVELVDTQAVPRPHDATLAVADQLWHHFDGPRALRTGDRVFRFVDGAIDPAQTAELEDLWNLLGRARVLTVTRSLPTGSVAINDHLHDIALDRLSVSGRPDFVPGEPVMVTANDYQRGLFNGDQGIVVRADEGLGRHHYRAVFRCGGQLRPFAIEALRDRLELAWALTIHKSQGSELDAVALLLPHDDLPLVTRELLYTGVTRARTGVVIAGSRAILAAGCKRRALRHSGLGERLRATLRP